MFVVDGICCIVAEEDIDTDAELDGVFDENGKLLVRVLFRLLIVEDC